MGKCAVYIDELRFDVRDPELTHVYVFVRAEGDCPHMIAGWHHQAFPASQTTEDISKLIWNGKTDPLTWPHKAPDEPK